MPVAFDAIWFCIIFVAFLCPFAITLVSAYYDDGETPFAWLNRKNAVYPDNAMYFALTPVAALATVAIGILNQGTLFRDSLRQVNWPDTWDLFSYFLPKKTRERVFEPAREDLLKQYRKSNRKYKNKAARLILNLAWSFRFAILVADCWRALLTDKAFGLLLNAVPEPVKQWWRPL